MFPAPAHRRCLRRAGKRLLEPTAQSLYASEFNTVNGDDSMPCQSGRRCAALCAIALAILFTSQYLAAQSAIEGVVRSRAGGPVAGAMVTISGAANLRRTAQTDRNGHFAAADLPEGKYTVAVTASGFTS